MNIKTIQAAFRKLRIQLKSRFSAQILPEGVTNTFLTATDTSEGAYLVRVNGPLWAPFTREDERYHLERLEGSGVPTTVIYQDPKHRFQISKLLPKNLRLSEAHNQNKETMQRLSAEIRAVHSVGKFKQHFNIGKTVQSAMKGLPAPLQSQLRHLYQMVLNIAFVLKQDTAHHVSSHNDLLPSSIYCLANAIQLVDWEYASENHRAYDLAFVAVKSNLSRDHEEELVTAYDPEDALEVKHSVMLTKPVISFLLFAWAARKKQDTPLLSLQLIVHCQEALFSQSAKQLSLEYSLFYRAHAKAEERALKKKLSSPAPKLLAAF